jgi:hypothetical protein
VVHRVGVLHSALYHGQLFQIVIIVAVRRSAHVASLGPLVVTHWQVWQFLLCFAHLVKAAFFLRVYCRDLALLVELCAAAGTAHHGLRASA